MLRKYLRLLASVGFAALLSLGLPSPALAQAYLGTNLLPFAVLGATPSVTCTESAGQAVITGDIGVTPAASITGFPAPCTNASGALHLNDQAAIDAKANLLTAYGVLDAQSCGSTIGPNLNGLTLTQGVYCVGAAATNLSGTLTLNAQGNANASWTFKMSSSLITSPGSTVNFSNAPAGGENACAVQWLVPSSATLDTTTTFVGNILAFTSITMAAGANLTGRALARNGTVTMDSNTVTFAPCGAGGGGGGAGVPTLSEWAMIALSLLLALAGAVAMRS
ncbi:MAG: ice-binding family protein, partial [Candidatus Limnocylindrales bacterium]|nr:ice-binding family protein [Candidatus Limnocylindrales bacterium]